MQVTLHRYVLAVPDLERARIWYERVLGCRTIELDPGNWLLLQREAVGFMLGFCPDAMPATDLGITRTSRTSWSTT